MPAEPSDEPNALFAWCETVLQTRLSVRGETSHTHNESRVWKLETADGAMYYVKAHRRRHKWEQEAGFYEHYLPLAPPESQAQTPRLLAVRDDQTDDEPRALLLSALPGVPLETFASKITRESERAAWTRAGRYLREFHSIPAGDGGWFGAIGRGGNARLENPPTSPVGLIVQDLENALMPLPGGVCAATPREITQGREAIAHAEAAFANEPPVLCQRDFSPRNWIISEQGEWVGVIDFEHTRRDLRVFDFARLYDDTFCHRPDLQSAFWHGYGDWPAGRERFEAQLKSARTAQALGQIKWARAHNDAPFEARGHDALERLR